jgi:hypothetical protein
MIICTSSIDIKKALQRCIDDDTQDLEKLQQKMFCYALIKYNLFIILSQRLCKI